MNAIIQNLPVRRQTLLFSATQTKSVSSLARLSLRDPEYVSAHADASAPTPVKLEQAYMICNLEDKMDVVWSFIKTHLSFRVIVFLSTCKQVRYMYEAFRRLRPGTPLRCLHGRMSQQKRMVVYQQFCESKAGVLFATDIAARGLDFPSVDWVVQADCPEDVASYIHRVGRTARYINSGRGLILLVPSEQEGMIAALREAKISLKCLKYNKEKIQQVTPALQALLSKDPQLKEIAQKALVSYLRSVFLQPNKSIFDVTKLPTTEFAMSLGLTTMPKLKMLSKASAAHKTKEIPSTEFEYNKVSKNISSVEGSNMEEKEEEDEFLVVKKKHQIETDPTQSPKETSASIPEPEIKTKKKKKKLKIDPYKTSGSKVIFDDKGVPLDPLEALAGEMDTSNTKTYKSVAERAAAVQKRLKERDNEDKFALKQLRKAKRDAKRAKRLANEGSGSHGVLLQGMSGDETAAGDSSPSEMEEYSKNGDILFDSDEDLPRPIETAHIGMTPVASDHGSNKKEKKAQRNKPSLEDQEAAALQILRAQ